MDLILLERLFLILFEYFRFSDRSIKVGNITNRLLGLSKGWPQPLDIKSTIGKMGKFRDFQNWPPIIRWPHHTGSTALWFSAFPAEEDYTATTSLANYFEFFSLDSPSQGFFEISWHYFPSKVSKRTTLQNIRRSDIFSIVVFPLLYTWMQLSQ